MLETPQNLVGADQDPYDANGIDRSLIRWMLSLSPTERLAVAQGSIDLVESVRPLSDGAG
ncbi:hypothetical protein [Polyangium sorediatum]|uniref:Uncharacterized protein n=1 Tax=Polyangium sorediatum TaxID=889274 RepID=A0ABT6P6B8_9BACT|nr:hypothetical protein [Polyangium sorediatum]MDI1436169.1 hypothetical protein [Polyangium sorediatum]